MIRIGVLVSGRGSNLQALLDACREGRIDGQVVVVLSDKADAYGLERARQAGIAAIHVDPAAFATRQAYDQRLAETLQQRDVDLVVLAGYMRLVKKPMLDAFTGRIINVHPALLPSFKGLEAQRKALEYGVKVTGATVHFVTEGLDDGPIILQAAVPVLDDDTVESLSERILAQEHRILPEAVQLFALGKLKFEGRRVTAV
ncbi:MAG TPA: phosphoribosylglycinamide formyltransferase [Symbiobacteriaceae bacterium]|jgi:phosphoribosylglycinamide formyltransferase-1|nr:phosphoribosylglycinamide formyltransferase [Symbiobacteriaceae bacterium]